MSALRALPDTLGGRIALIVIGGFLVGHVLSVAILAPGARRMNGPLEQAWTGELALAARALDAVPAEARDALVDHMRRAGIDATAAPTPADPAPAAVDRRADDRAAALLGRAATVSIDPGDADTGRPPTIRLSTTLGDGSAIVLSRTADADLRPRPEAARLGGVALLWIGITLAVALVAVRLAVRPLEVLARAADALGRDLARPPLAARGPSEVRRTAATINGMQARIAAHVAQRTRMLAAISHDLQTPLARLRMRVEGVHDARLRERMERDIDDMRVMIEDTLALMREAGDRAGARVAVDVDALVEALVIDAREAGGAVALAGSAGAPVPAWPIALRRAVGNLIDNALRHAGGAEVELAGDADAVRVRVSDRGPGLAPEHMARAGEPYFRADEARRRGTGGSGLGLAITRSIARAHGGDVTFAPRAGGGLVATLAIARSPSAAPGVPAAEATIGPQAPGW